MHPLYRHITSNNNLNRALFTPLYFAGMRLGLLHPSVLQNLKDAQKIHAHQDGVAFAHEPDNAAQRTAFLNDILQHLITARLIKKQRHELFAVSMHFSDAPVALADRALMPALGFKSYGVHCNGYVLNNNHQSLWVGRRSLSSSTDPGKFDHIIAGGQPHGLTPFENLTKEAQEEAGLSPEIIAHAKSVGSITYNRQQENGVRRDTLFIFDLLLDNKIIPHNQDGETLDFRLLTIPEVLDKLTHGSEFKFNVNLVLIDFMIRHGHILSDEPYYNELVLGLHQRHDI